MNRYFALLVRRLQERAADPTNADSRDGVVDLVRWYNFTTFDLIGDLAFGEPFGSLERGAYHPWISTLLQGIRFGSRIARVARAWPALGLLLRLVIRLVPSIGAAGKRHRAYSRDKVASRLAAKTDRKDFMSYVRMP